MKKTFFEAEYRIKNKVYNHGHICITNDFITGIFSLDCISIQIKDGYIYLYLKEYEPEDKSYYETIEFIGKCDVKTLESPYTYILKSDDDEYISLKLIKRLSDPKTISDISKEFEMIFGE